MAVEAGVHSPAIAWGHYTQTSKKLMSPPRRCRGQWGRGLPLSRIRGQRGSWLPTSWIHAQGPMGKTAAVKLDPRPMEEVDAAAGASALPFCPAAAPGLLRPKSGGACSVSPIGKIAGEKNPFRVRALDPCSHRLCVVESVQRASTRR